MRTLMGRKPRHPRKIHGSCMHIVCLWAIMWMFSGCIAKVQIPTVEQFRIASGTQAKSIDAEAHKEILLTYLHQLLKANEGVEIPFCTATQESRQCIKEGIGVFVLGGVIPGKGKRTSYAFSEISLEKQQLTFTKDNSGTTFIGTPMLTRKNKCQASVKNGGIQVEMEKYYASWAGIGHMFMAEGWAIDFMDLHRGLVGLQLELDIKGYVTTGGGSSYVLLKFPNIPEGLPSEPQIDKSLSK